MTWYRTEEEVDEIIQKMKSKKGRHITQGVSFNKNCPRQMDLLKKALMSSASFSGLVKELLAKKFSEDDSTIIESPLPSNDKPTNNTKPNGIDKFL